MEMTLGTWQIAINRIHPSQQELAKMYDSSATRWHSTIRKLGYLKAYTDLFGRLQHERRLEALTSQARVLDCGVGTGGLSLSLAQTVDRDLLLEGVDLSSHMLEIAQTLLGEAGLKSKMHHRSAQNLGFADNVFDLAMGAHLIEHVSNPQAVIQEMVRVLEPGSPFLLIVSQPGLYTALIQRRWRYTAYKPQTVMQMMSETGLVDLKMYTLNGSLPSRTSLAYIGIKNSSKSNLI